MGKRFIKSFLFIAAFVMAAFSTNLLPVTAASASNNNPGGNNGFVKVNGTKFDDIPNNDPHVGCKFRIEFYNYDQNSGQANVNFELQNPTKGPGYSLAVTGGNLNPYINADGAGGSNDVDADETYTLNFTGAPQQNQGYHVKLTVTAQGTNGNNTKHKVFWVKPCEKPDVDTQVTPCTNYQAGTGTVVVSVRNTNVTTVNYTVELGATTKNVTINGGSSKDVAFAQVAPGTYVVKVTGDNDTQKTTSVTVTACQPVSPTVTVSDEVCSDPYSGINNGSAKVSVENASLQAVTYQVTLGGVTKTLTLQSQVTGWVTFTGLASGSHALEVIGSDDTNVQRTIVIPACQAQAPKIDAEAVGCSWAHQAIGSGVVTIENPNSYSVTYDVTLNNVTKTITIGAYDYGHVWFDHLSLTSYTATVIGNNNTSATASFDMYECAPMPVPSAPILEVNAPCVAAGATGDIFVKVTNPDSFDVDYVVALDGIYTVFVTVAAHSSQTVTFSGFPAGTYGILSNTPGFKNVTRIPVTSTTCSVAPTTPGQTLGTSTTRTVTTLPKTGPNSSIGLLLAVLAASVTYTIVLAIQKRRFATASNK